MTVCMCYLSYNEFDLIISGAKICAVDLLSSSTVPQDAWAWILKFSVILNACMCCIQLIVLSVLFLAIYIPDDAVLQYPCITL